MYGWVDERSFDQVIIYQRFLLLRLECACAAVILKILILSHLRPVSYETSSVATESPQKDV